MAQPHEVRTYTIGRPPQTTGLGGLSLKVTMVLIGTFVLTMGAITFQQWKIGVGFAVAGGVLIVLVNWTIGGRSIGSKLQLTHQQNARNRRGENLFVSGPDSHMPGGRFSLPGVLARPELIESMDSTDQPYALLVDRPANRVTVFFDLQLTGAVDKTAEERDQQVADWGRFEQGLSLSGDVDSCVVVVANRPATGELAAQEVAKQVKDGAPTIARIVMGETARLLPSGAGEVDAHMALTFNLGPMPAGDDSFISQMDYRIPNIYPQLVWAGIQAEPMDYEGVVAKIHSFYNPSTETLFERLRVDGRSHHMTWDNAGPSWALSGKKYYAHENCKSVTWEMIEAPASTFEDGVLGPLARPNIHVARSRMAMIYEPVPASKGMRMVEREHKDALVGMNSSKSITKIGATVRAEETEQARRDVARGAQMGRRSLMYTATVAPGEDMDKAIGAVEQAGSQSSIRLEQYKGMHDAGFALTAGMGLTPMTRATNSGLFG